MTGRDVPEDHQGGDAAPAAVTCAFLDSRFSKQFCDGTCKTRLQHTLRNVIVIGEMMFGRQPGDGPFTCDDDGKPIT